jgi:hypothetical protein
VTHQHQDNPTSARRAIESLQEFSLLQALFGRRSRRFGVGMEIPDGPLAYKSAHPPQALSEFERTLLIVAGAGISGLNFGIPFSPSMNEGAGCNYTVRPIGRTYPSGAATYGSEMVIVDDSGIYITKFRELDASRIQEYQGADDIERLMAWLKTYIIKISDQRLDLPAEAPHISAHNRWVANRPGTTLFFPISDQVDSLMNHLWIRTSEGYAIKDHVTGRILGKPDALVKAGKMDLSRAVPLSLFEGNSRNSTTAELSITSYNIQLLMQAMGLGGWLFSGINMPSLFGAFKDQGIEGFGFRFQRNDKWLQPNPVGLDGIFEPLIPPYVSDMYEAVRKFADRKFGARGNHHPERFGPYQDNQGIKSQAQRPSPEFIEYLGSLAQDIYDTYGKFPATIPSIGLAAYTQAHHIDMDFYDKFYGDGAYLETHVNHQKIWHAED